MHSIHLLRQHPVRYGNVFIDGLPSFSLFYSQWTSNQQQNSWCDKRAFVNMTCSTKYIFYSFLWENFTHLPHAVYLNSIHIPLYFLNEYSPESPPLFVATKCTILSLVLFNWHKHTFYFYKNNFVVLALNMFRNICSDS
jgi:hypothetical protein